MRRSEAFKSKYLGKDDLQNGPLELTINECDKVILKDDDGKDEEKVYFRFAEHPKPWLVNFTNWSTCEDAFGEESDDWIGRRIEIFVDTTVMMKGKRTGGVRCRVPSKPMAAKAPVQSDEDLSFETASPAPTMTYDEALAKCFDAGISKEQLRIHMIASGQDVWNSNCPQHVERLLRMDLAAKNADAAKAAGVEDDTKDLEADIQF